STSTPAEAICPTAGTASTTAARIPWEPLAPGVAYPLECCIPLHTDNIGDCDSPFGVVGMYGNACVRPAEEQPADGGVK
ncbi:MAG: hypothetical protein R6V85_09570, partial [Polyangia bacterium]